MRICPRQIRERWVRFCPNCMLRSPCDLSIRLRLKLSHVFGEFKTGGFVTLKNSARNSNLRNSPKGGDVFTDERQALKFSSLAKGVWCERILSRGTLKCIYGWRFGLWPWHTPPRFCPEARLDSPPASCSRLHCWERYSVLESVPCSSIDVHASAAEPQSFGAVGCARLASKRPSRSRFIGVPRPMR
jgi:hypothetical protein